MAIKTILLFSLTTLIMISSTWANIKDFIIESEADLRRFSDENEVATDDDDDYYADEAMYNGCGDNNPMYSMMMGDDMMGELDANTLQRLIAEAIANNMIVGDTTSDVGFQCPAASAAAAYRSQELENYHSCMEDGSIPMTEELFNLL